MKIKKTRQFKLFGEERFKITNFKPAADPIIDLEGALEKRKYLVWEFSGGGIKGVMSAYIAYVLERHYQDIIRRRLKKLWGCSTGAIIAALYNLGLYLERKTGKNPWTMAEILRWYVEQGPIIFHERFLSGGWGSLYNTKRIEKVLKDNFGKLTFTDLHRETGIELNIRVINAIENKPEVLSHKTASHFPVWAAVRASMSAPIFFPVFSYKGVEYADGGCGMYGCNAVPAYWDVYNNEGWKDFEWFLLSIGTGRKRVGKLGKNKISQLKWFFDYIREESTDEQERKLIKYKERYKLRFHRWNIELPDELTAMDNTDNIDELLKLVDK